MRLWVRVFLDPKDPQMQAGGYAVVGMKTYGVLHLGLRGPCSVWPIFQKLDRYIAEAPWNNAETPALEFSHRYILAALPSNTLELLALLTAALKTEAVEFRIQQSIIPPIGYKTED